MPSNIRIFISSPGDVAQERQIARRVLERLTAEFAQNVALEPYFWEYEPVIITQDYQEQIPPPSSFDIVICILWSRMGSRLHSRYTLPPDHVRVARSGTEFEIVDAIEGRRQHGSPDVLVWVNRTEPQVPLTAADRDERIRQWEQLQSFLKEWTRDSKEQVFTGAVNSYRTKDEFEEQLEVKLRKLILARAGGQGQRKGPSWQGNPYRGLEAFEYEHDSIFFGRTAAVDAVVNIARNRLKAAWSGDADARAFVLILGGSGSGKSSLVRAGVVPMLVKGNVVEGVGLWRRAVLKPSDGHGDLFLAMMSASAKESALPELFNDGSTPAQLARRLREHPAEIGGLVKGALSQAAAQLLLEEQTNLRAAIEQERKAGRANDVELLTQRLAGLKQRRACLVLVLDQLEELFTGEARKDEIESFLQAIDLLAADGHVLLLATLRSDFFSHCEEYDVLMRLKAEDGTMHLAPPRRHELAQMIRGPAQRAGVCFEERSHLGRLDEFLVDASASDCDSLPLLELCLHRLFEHGKADGMLGFSEYEEIGRIEGLISNQAEQVYSSVSPGAQNALEAVIRSLTTISEQELGGEHRAAFARRVALYDELVEPAGARELVDALIKARLFSTSEDAGGRATVSVAHEAMLRHWKRVRDWLAAETNQRFLRVRAQVAQRLRQWEQSIQEGRDGGADSSFLLQPGRELSAAAEQLALHPNSFSRDEKQFIENSMAERRRRQHRARNIRNAVGVALLMLAALSIAAAIVASRQKREAVASKNLAEKNLQIAIEMVDRLGFNSSEHRRMLEPTDRVLAELARTDEELVKLAGSVQSVPLKVHQLDFLTGASAAFLDVGHITQAVEYGWRAVALAHEVQQADSSVADIQAKDAQARLAFAQALLAAGQPAMATDTFRQAITLSKDLQIQVSARIGVAKAAIWKLRPQDVQDELLELQKIIGGFQKPNDEQLSWKVEIASLEARTIDSLKIDPPDQREQSRRDMDDAVAALHDLIAHDSGDLRWKRLGADFWNWRSQLASTRDEREEARRAVEQSRLLIDELGRHDANNLDWRMGRARNALNSGSIAADDGDWPRAIANVADASRTIDQLLAVEPTSFDAHQARIWALFEQARAASHGGPIKELEAYHKLTAIAAQDLAKMPSAPIFSYDEALGCWYQAAEQMKAGHFDLAIALDRRGAEAMAALRENGCIDNRVMEIEAFLRASMAKALLAQNKLDEAVAGYTRAASLLLEGSSSRAQGWRFKLIAGIQIELADTLVQHKQLERADSVYQQAEQAYDHARAVEPVDSDWFANQSIIESRRADILQKLSRLPEATAAMERSVAILIEGASKDPSNKTLNELLASNRQAAQKLAAELDQRPPAERPAPLLRRLVSIMRRLDAATNLVPQDFKQEGNVLVAKEAQSWSLPPLMPASWRTLAADEQKREVEQLAKLDKRLSPQRILHVRSTRLDFYDDALLYEAQVRLENGSSGALEYLRHGGDTYILKGKSDVIRQLNGLLPLRIDTIERATQYLRFFTSALQGEQGSFLIVDEADDFHWLEQVPPDTRQKVARLCRPLIVESASGGDWAATGTVQYADALFYARFRIPRDGVVAMFADAPVAAELKLQTQSFIDGIRMLKYVPAPTTKPATQPATRPH